MTVAVQRMIPMPGGKRKSLTLEPVTWAAIETLAASAHIDWQHWCANVLAKTSGSTNVTRDVRAAVTEALMLEAFAADRAELMARPQPALLASSGEFGDQDFLADMATAREIDGTEDYGGFEFTTGTDHLGRACIWIRNGLRDQPHLVIPLPFSTQQLEEETENPTWQSSSSNR